MCGKLIRWSMVAVLVVCGLVRAEQTAVDVQADVEVGKKPGTTENMTIIQQDGGETRVLSKDVVTSAETPERRAGAESVAADTAPRKARVAVVPAVLTQETRSKFARELQEKWGMSDLGVVEYPGYTSFLVDALVNTRKLDILERENLDPAIKEIDFGESDYADVSKVVKLGRMVNADFVVIPEIRYLSLAEKEKHVPYVNQQQQVVDGKLATAVRVVDVATSRIVASRMGSVQNKTRFRESKGPKDRQFNDFLSGLYIESAAAEAAHVIDAAYPIKVVAIAGHELTINRGKGAIDVGEVLNVYQAGEIMVDPDTKENLGYHEVQLGQATVTEVADKTAKAEMSDGADKVQKLDICRRTDAVMIAAPAEPPAPRLD